MCKHLRVHTVWHTLRPEDDIRCPAPSLSTLSPLRQGPSPSLELSSFLLRCLVSQQTLVNFLSQHSSTPSTGIAGMHCTATAGLMGVWGIQTQVLQTDRKCAYLRHHLPGQNKSYFSVRFGYKLQILSPKKRGGVLFVTLCYLSFLENWVCTATDFDQTRSFWYSFHVPWNDTGQQAS